MDHSRSYLDLPNIHNHSPCTHFFGRERLLFLVFGESRYSLTRFHQASDAQLFDSAGIQFAIRNQGLSQTSCWIPSTYGNKHLVARSWDLTLEFDI